MTNQTSTGRHGILAALLLLGLASLPALPAAAVVSRGWWKLVEAA